jgi:hypothetical protein
MGAQGSSGGMRRSVKRLEGAWNFMGQVLGVRVGVVEAKRT